MKATKKALLMVLCAALLVTATVMGTVAYLTDTESVKNTFTVGRVGLSLDEAKVNLDGTYVTDKTNRVAANEYHLLPGHTYTKDPTIHVDADSDECYLFVKVENGLEDIEAKGEKSIAAQMERLDWEKVDGVDDVYILAKGEENKTAVSYGADVVVFESFTIDGSVDNTNLAAYKDAEIIVTAYAVQKDGFENMKPEEIWETAFPNA